MKLFKASIGISIAVFYLGCFYSRNKSFVVTLCLFFTFLMFYFLFFFKLHFCWSTVVLQNCVRFRYTGKWILFLILYPYQSVQFSCSVMSDSLWPHWLEHTRLPCPSPTPRVYTNSCPLSQWCHPTISSFVIPFFSQLQSFQSQILHSLKIGHRKLRMNFPHFTWCSLLKRL